VAMNDVRKRVKDGINGKVVDADVTQAKELENVKKILADLGKMLTDQQNKQDLLLSYFQQMHPNFPKSLKVALPSSSGDVAGFEGDELDD